MFVLSRLSSSDFPTVISTVGNSDNWSVAPPSSGRVTITVPLPRLGRFLWASAATLVGLDFAAAFGSVLGAPFFVTRFFDADQKLNFPTMFKTTMLGTLTVICVAMLLVERQRGGIHQRLWLALAGIAGFAWVDESTYLHQSINELLHDRMGLDGVLRYSWVALYLPVVVATSIIVLPALLRMRHRVARGILGGGALFGLAALGLEPVKSMMTHMYTDRSLAFRLTAAVSDSLEMIALTIMVIAVVRYLLTEARPLVLLGVEQLPSAATVQLPND